MLARGDIEAAVLDAVDVIISGEPFETSNFPLTPQTLGLEEQRSEWQSAELQVVLELFGAELSPLRSWDGSPVQVGGRAGVRLLAMWTGAERPATALSPKVVREMIYESIIIFVSGPHIIMPAADFEF